MKAALIEFRLESASQNVREFYAGRMGTHNFFTRDAVRSAVTGQECLARNRKAEFQPLRYRFDATPAMGIQVRTLEVVYKAGDRPDAGLLRFGKQELLMPGSVFRCAIWGDIPTVRAGQIIFIGKKRAPAEVSACVVDEVISDYTTGGAVLPLQVAPDSMPNIYSLIAITARYAIVRVPLSPDVKRFSLDGYAVPLLEGL